MSSTAAPSPAYRFLELRPVPEGEDPWSEAALTAAISETTLPPGDSEVQEKVRRAATLPNTVNGPHDAWTPCYGYTVTAVWGEGPLS